MLEMMKRGPEIVRRLFLIIIWGIVVLFTVMTMILGINEFTDEDGEKIKNEEEAEKIIKQIDSWDKETMMTYDEALEQIEVLDNLENYYQSRERKKKEMFLFIGFPILCPLIGFGLHKLVNQLIFHEVVSEKTM